MNIFNNQLLKHQTIMSTIMMTVLVVFTVMKECDAQKGCSRFKHARAPCLDCTHISFVRKESDCRRYSVCVNGRPFFSTMKCRQNMVWSNKRRTCVTAGSVDDDCNIKQSHFKIPWNVKPAWKTCGAKISPNIVGGSKTRPGEWPWVVSLQLKDRYSPQYIHFCGGVVIDEKWILTASHCVINKQRVRGLISVVLGAYQLSKPSKTQQRRGVEHIFVHPRYVDAGSFPNDVALLKLADPVDFHDGIIRDICLPQPGEVVEDEGDRSSELGCWLAGWGVTQRSGNGDVLQELKTNIVNYTFCKKQWGDFVNRNHICVGMGDRGACRGDSGGPLMCSKGGRFYIVGIVSWGEETCMEYGYPNIFTKVHIYSRWIQNTISSNP